MGAGAAALVAATGLALGYSGTVSLVRGADATESTGALAYYACPNTGAMGQLHPGDRVYITGVDSSGDWIQVRAPHDPDDRSWVQRQYVALDDELDVSVATCSLDVGGLELIDGPDLATTTSTTEPNGEPDQEVGDEVTEDDPTESTTTTSTTAPPTTAPPTTVPPTTTPPATTPPTIPTTTTTIPRPSIGTINRSPGTIIEDYVCVGLTTSEISVNISGATSATMSWSVGSSEGATSMSRNGSTFTAVLGPFGEEVVDGPAFLDISVTITASGPGGAGTPRSTTVRLDDCYFG